jgi:hypothetical protein
MMLASFSSGALRRNFSYALKGSQWVPVVKFVADLALFAMFLPTT